MRRVLVPALLLLLAASTACAGPRLVAGTPGPLLPDPVVRRVRAPAPRVAPLVPAVERVVEVALLCAT